MASFEGRSCVQLVDRVFKSSCDLRGGDKEVKGLPLGGALTLVASSEEVSDEDEEAGCGLL